MMRPAGVAESRIEACSRTEDTPLPLHALETAAKRDLFGATFLYLVMFPAREKELEHA
jgi:hypothetical protein